MIEDNRVFNSNALRPYEARALEAYRRGDFKMLLEWVVYGPCGCLGARDGEPECPCKMRAAAAKKVHITHKFEACDLPLPKGWASYS